MLVGIIVGAAVSIVKADGSSSSNAAGNHLRGGDSTAVAPSPSTFATNSTVKDNEQYSLPPSTMWVTSLAPTASQVLEFETESARPEPTGVPSEKQTIGPQTAPTQEPTAVPTDATSVVPTVRPTEVLSAVPTLVPVLGVSSFPTVDATLSPTAVSSVAPMLAPTGAPVEQTMEPSPKAGFQLLTTDDIRSAVDLYLAGKLDVPINEWDVSQITDFSYLFSANRNSAAADFNEDLNNWKTSNVASLSGMLSNAKSFNGDISTWDTSQVSSFDRVFDGASSFSGDISEWSTDNAKTFFSMFRGASSFNAAIGNWKTDSVRNFSNMFQGASSFNQGLSWVTSSAVDMSRMVRPPSMTLFWFCILLYSLQLF